jgi:pimeloyl-ACP methyl ester carboxylesterase
VVLLHGLAGSAREFFPTAAALPGFRTVLMDLRGHGGSTRCPSDVSREAYAADVVRVIEHVACGPAVLVGQSMGGHTAMLAAATRPDLVTGLVLLEAVAGGGDPAELAALGEYFASWPTSFSSREAACDFFGGGPLAQAWAADLEKQGDGFRPRFQSAVMAGAAVGLAEDRWAEWESLRIPVLAVFAGKGMFQPEVKDELARRGHNVRRVDLPGASHDAHLDAFEDWVHALHSFLRSAG